MMNIRIAIIKTFMPIFIIHFKRPKIIINNMAIIIISIIILSPGYNINRYLREKFVSFEPSDDSYNNGYYNSYD